MTTMFRRVLTLLFTLCFLPMALWAQSKNSEVAIIDNSYLHLKILESNEFTKPYVWQDFFILSFSDKKAHRFVGVAFEHEDYAIVHSFYRTPNGTYVYYNKLPDLDSIKYRLVVDSIWQEDKNSDDYEIDPLGVKVSVLNLPVRSINISGPVVRNDGYIDFYLHASASSQVFLMGNFTAWDPFLYPMAEIKEGFYKISIPLSKGIYYYSFLVNGQRTIDPANLDRLMLKSTGEVVSRIEMPSY